MGRKTKVALTVGAASIAAWAASKAVAKPVPREGKKALEFDNPIILANRGGSIGGSRKHNMRHLQIRHRLASMDLRLISD